MANKSSGSRDIAMKGLVPHGFADDRVRAQFEHMNEIHQTFWLSKQAIIRTVAYGQQMQAALAYRRDFPSDDTDIAEMEKHARHAEEVSKLAKSEVENDFPILHGQVAVSLWGIFEAIIEDILVDWMELVPNALDNAVLGRLKLPLSQFIQLERREQCALVLRELQRFNGAESAVGVTVAERVLDVFGLVPLVDAAQRRDLFELHNVRNLIVHRGALVDDKFVAACPWTALATGTRLLLGSEDYGRYAKCVSEYVIAVIGKADAVDRRWRRKTKGSK